MATKKKATAKTAPVKAAKPSTKVAPVKQPAKPAKKPVEQKAEPAKKPAPAKKPVAKKPEPAKKPVAKKAEPAKKPVATKTEPAKKPVAKKAEPAKKPVAAKTEPAKKPVAKKVEPAKKPESPKKVETTTKSKKPTATPKAAEKVKADPVETKAPSTKKPTNNSEKSTKATKGGKDNATDKPVATGMRTTSPLTPKYPVLRPKGDHKKSASVRHITRTPFKDADLEEFKRRLLEERDRKIKLQNSMSADALSRPDEENVEEDGTNSANRADMLNRAEETRKSLLAIDDALRAIENKTYGICAVCKCAITRERLRAAPFAIRCVKCKEEWERQVKASKRSMNL